MENLLKKLLAEGVSQAMAEAIIGSIKPKKEKVAKNNAKAYYAKKAEVEKEITVITRCLCCNTTVSEKVMMVVKGESPDTQRTVISVCKTCPEFLARLSIVELISIILLGEKTDIDMQLATIKTKIGIAKKLSPEQIVNFSTKGGSDAP